MKNKSKLLTFLALFGFGIGAVGCNSIKNIESEAQEESLELEPNLDLVEPYSEVDETTYLIDTHRDELEHSFKVEDMRPVIKAFIETHRALAPWQVEELLSAVGKVSTSDTYIIKPSQYEMYDMKAVNENNEEVTITFKEGRVISKTYKKNTNDKDNRNLAFVNYDSKLYKTEYSSGIYTDAIDNNIAKDEEIWNLEEQVFSIFN